MKIFYSFIFMFCFTAIQAQPESISPKNIDEYNMLVGLAAKKGMTLVITIDDYSTNTLSRMKKDKVYRNDSIKEFLENSLFFKTSIYDSIGYSWNSLIEITSYPTFIFIDSKDEFVYNKTNGYQSTQEIIKAFSTYHSNKDVYPSLVNAYSQHSLSKSQWIQLLEIQEFNNDFSNCQKLALEFLATIDKQEFSDPIIESIAYKYALSLETPYPVLLATAVVSDSSKTAAKKWNKYAERVFNYNLELSVLSEDTILLENLNTNWIPQLTTLELDQLAYRYQNARYYSEKTDDFKIFQNEVLNYSSTLMTDSTVAAEWLFDEAYGIVNDYNTKASIQSALELSLKAISVHVDFRYLMLTSYIYYLQSNEEKALQLSGQAEAISKTESEKQKVLQLEKLIKSKPISQ